MTMKAILTSSLGGQVKMDGKRLPSKLPETNGLLKSIKAVWKNDSKVMIISGSPEYYDKNDSVLFCLKGAFSLSNLSASEVLMCDERNKEIIERLGWRACADTKQFYEDHRIKRTSTGLGWASYCLECRIYELCRNGLCRSGTSGGGN